MRARKPEELFSTAMLTRLATQAMMGAAMGLSFALILAIANPSGIADLLQDAGANVFIGVLTMTFGIGSALTGAVFMLGEERGP